MENVLFVMNLLMKKVINVSNVKKYFVIHIIQKNIYVIVNKNNIIIFLIIIK